MDKYFLKPKYWDIWILISIAKLLVNILSYKTLMRLAIFIGYLTKPLIKKRQKITVINLKIAFPEKSDKEIKKLANKSYKSACIAGFESLIAWFMSEKNFKKINFDDSELTTFINAHNNKNRPTIFHFHTLEIVSRHSGISYSPLTLMYQKHKNPLMEYLITSSRKKYVKKCFQRKNIIPVIKSLKKIIRYGMLQTKTLKNI